MVGKRYVIIGASAAGITAALKIRALDDKAIIMVITKESTLPYNKCFLADLVSGTKEEQALFLRPEIFFQEKCIDLVFQTIIVSIDVKTKQVMDKDGSFFPYDVLLIATGGEPFVPDEHKNDIKGDGIFVFHTLENVQSLLSYCSHNTVKSAVVIGAGLSGLECADALRERYKMKVTIVDRASSMLYNQISHEAACYLEKKAKAAGICFLPEKTVQQVYRNAKNIEIIFSDNEKMQTDMVIYATGTQWNKGLPQSAGIICVPQGIKVNEYLQTSVPDIYAAGDCIAIQDLLTGMIMRSCMWSDAMQQGAIAADNMVGKIRAYQGAAVVISSSFFGLKCAITGGFKELAKKDTTLVFHENNEFYHHIIGDDNKKVTGFLLLGNTQQVPLLKRLLLTKQVYEGY